YEYEELDEFVCFFSPAHIIKCALTKIFLRICENLESLSVNKALLDNLLGSSL
ncbi:16238_t:CDS:1, partial [Dentiscutata erythropus]